MGGTPHLNVFPGSCMVGMLIVIFRYNAKFPKQSYHLYSYVSLIDILSYHLAV